MRNKVSTAISLRGYNAVRRTGLLNTSLFRRIFLSSYFFYKRWHEDPFEALAKKHPELFAEGDILDVGANIGYTACVFAAARKAPAKVYAFEPDQDSFATLADVVRRKKLLGAVEIFNSAVGAADGTLEFWHNDEHSADHRVATAQFKALGPDRSKISTVRVTSIDNFVANHNLSSISFIKIDVQGYEAAVCEGMKQTLERFRPVSIACEYAPESMQSLGFEPEILLQFFRSAGYQLHILTRDTIQLAPDDRSIDAAVQRCGYVDLLCSRRVLT